MAEPSDPFDAMEKSGVAPPPATDPFEAMENPQRANREVVVPNYLKNMLASEQTWESVAPKLKEQFGVDPKDYEQNYRLGEAHAVQKQQPLSMSEAYRQHVPFGFLGDASGIKTYGAAKRRYDEGKGTKEDAHTIAEYERIQGQLAGVKESFLGKVVTGVGGLSQVGAEMGVGGAALGQVARVPGAIGRGASALGFGAEAEALAAARATGTVAPAALGTRVAQFAGNRAALTATAPSFFVDQARQTNVAAGREADDIRGYPTAIAMGYANNLVLGSLQSKIGAGMPGGLFGRSVAKGTLGAGEAAGVEAAGGIADEFLNDAYKTNTKYGPIGKLLGIRQPFAPGEAVKDFAATAVTFSLFSGLHGAIDKPELNKEKAQTALDKAVEAIDSAKTPAEAAQKVKELTRKERADEEERVSITEARHAWESAGNKGTPPPEYVRRVVDSRKKIWGPEPAAAPTPEKPPEPPSKAPPEAGEGDYVFDLSVGGFRQRKPGETGEASDRPPEAAPEAEKPPTQAPAEAEIVAPERSGEVFPDVLKAAGLEGRHEVEASKIAGEGRGEVAVLGYGDRFVSLEHDPKTNSVRIDFDYQDRNAHATPVPKGLGHGSLDIGRDMKRLVVELHDKGLGVNYSADPRRDATYGRMLTDMGYKLESRTVGEKGQVSASWKPDPEAIRSVSELAKAKAKEAQLQKEIADERARQQGSGVVPAPDANPGVPRSATGEVPSSRAGAPVLYPEAKQPATPAANPPAPANRRQGVRPSETIIAVVKRFGGIDPNSKSFRDHYPGGMREAIREDKFPVGVFKKGGRGLDDLAHELHGSQHIAEPSEQLLLDMIRSRAPSHSAERQGDQMLAAHELKELNTFKEQHREALRNENPSWSEADIERNVESIVRHGETVAQQEAGAAQRAAELGQTPEPDHAGATDFNFGSEANPAKGAAPSAEVQAPASQAAGWPGGRSAGADIERNAAQLLSEKIAARQTEPGPTAMKRIEPQQAEFAQESGVRWYQSLRDFLRKLGGAKLAATRRLSEDSANAGANVDRSRLYGEAQAEDFNSQIFAGDDRTITRMIAGAVYSEMSLRKLRVDLLNTARKESNAGVQAKNAGDAKAAAEHFRKADEAGAKARNVGTVVGAMNPEESLSSPLGSEADFQHWSKDKDVLAILARADALVTPVNEALYRKAQGLGPNDPIPSKAMIDQPGIPKLSLVSLREGDLTPEQKVLGAEHEDTLPSEPGRGNLARHTLKKLGASRERTGAAKHGYELDLAEIVRRNLVDRQVNADRADYFRTMERSEIGAWSKPGERPHEGWRKLENVRPPKGTQAAEDGQIDFWVHPDAYPDARQLLEPKEQKWQLPLLAASTWATLRSTVDFVSHSRNLLTQWTRGARLRDIFDGVRKQVMDDPAFKKELVEVARLSALSDRHLDIGGGLGKIDPARYAGRVLGLMDRAVRVASLRAYDRLVDRGLDVENTDAARRDFINQVGNYSKLTQNRLVAWLRDTGVGPFSTAATTFWMHGLRTAAMRPGVRANSWKAQLQLQGEMLARVAVLPALAAIANYAFHKRADGDDNTPWGAVKLWTANGKTSYIDLAGLSGLSRGAREIGLKATIESMRPGAKKAGATPGSAADKAARDIGHGLLHPIVGPGVDVIHTLFTGDDAMGYPKAHHATADEKKKGESQLQYNALAAIFETNSLAEQWVKPFVLYGETPFGKAGSGLGIKKTDAEKKNEPTWGERAGKMFGPFGPVQSKKAPGAPIGSR